MDPSRALFHCAPRLLKGGLLVRRPSSTATSAPTSSGTSACASASQSPEPRRLLEIYRARRALRPGSSRPGAEPRPRLAVPTIQCAPARRKEPGSSAAPRKIRQTKRSAEGKPLMIKRPTFAPFHLLFSTRLLVFASFLRPASNTNPSSPPAFH
jgi:hypothetical protein